MWVAATGTQGARSPVALELQWHKCVGVARWPSAAHRQRPDAPRPAAGLQPQMHTLTRTALHAGHPGRRALTSAGYTQPSASLPGRPPGPGSPADEFPEPHARARRRAVNSSASIYKDSA